MNKFKLAKMRKREAQYEMKIKNLADLEEEIFYIENLKMCTKSEVRKKELENQIQNIKRWWRNRKGEQNGK